MSDVFGRNMVYSTYVRRCHDCERMFKAENRANHCPECALKNDMEKRAKLKGKPRMRYINRNTGEILRD